MFQGAQTAEGIVFLVTMGMPKARFWCFCYMRRALIKTLTIEALNLLFFKKVSFC
jgi:hypothetical protein